MRSPLEFAAMRSILCALLYLLWLDPSSGFAQNRAALSACDRARIGHRGALQMAATELKPALFSSSSSDSWGASTPSTHAPGSISLAGFPTTPIGGVAHAITTVPTATEATDSTAPAVSSLAVAALSDPVRRALSRVSDDSAKPRLQLTSLELALLVISAGGAAATPFLCPWLLTSEQVAASLVLLR